MRMFVWAALAAGVALLSGCAERVGGQERADKAALGIDHYGCPGQTILVSIN